MNFTNISNAIKAIDGVKNKPEYTNLRIAHGKDRCANPPRSGPQGASGTRRSASGNGGEPVSAIDGAPFDAELADAMVQQDEEEAMIASGVVVAAPEETQQMHVDGGDVSVTV